MKSLCYAVMSLVMLLAVIMPGGSKAHANGTLQIITPAAAGTATGGSYFPMQNAFDSPNIELDALTEEPVGDPGTNAAPYYTNRVGYIDFGSDWADVRITSTWTKYRTYSGGDMTPYAEIWWDDDTDTTNDSGLTETAINFNSVQDLPSTGATMPWIRDADVSSSPVAPQARYMLLRSPSTMTDRAYEYAIVGWMNADKPVTAIAVTGAGGADTISTNQGTLQMSAAITPVDATVQTVAWSVENGTGNASISTSGLLTAVSNGTVTVRATAQDGSGVSGTEGITITNQSSGTEALQVLTPVAAGTATGGSYYPLQNAFDGQPDLDENTGGPTGGSGTSAAPAYTDRVGYVDFGPDWSKVRITSTWTQYRAYSGGNQIPFQELWWDNDTDTINDSGLAVTQINFNSAQSLSTGALTPWVRDSNVSTSPVVPQARYLLAHSATTVTDRAKEYAFIGWVDTNGNGVQDAPFTPVSQIAVSAAGGKTSMLVSESLQMSAAVYPYTASNKTYAWSVANGTGSATISSGGLLTPVSEGTVTVKATAQDGSNVSGTLVIDISSYSSLILPVQGNSSIYYSDIQASFPLVDWDTLDRLYIPAGHYEHILFGNLPDRTAGDPLIITNYGGQVTVGGTHSYTFSISGGSHWILTGKYDAALRTGHSSYQGHLGGDYANSPGQYGIEVVRTNTSGIAVGGGATNFELSYIEIGYAGFAGLMLKTDNVPTATMDGVRVHDLYIHDAESEGMYIGNTGTTSSQHLFTDLELYNNRVLRTGTEGIQFSNMGDGVRIHHNVVAMCALDWKDPFTQWQDGCFQYSQRSGSAEVDHNVFIGGAGDTFEFWMTAATGETLDPNDEVWVHDNYFSHGRDMFAYIHDVAANYTTKLRFEDNIIRQFNYQYDELPGSQTDLGVMFFASDNTHNPMTFTDNDRDGSQVFIDTINGNNGTVGNVTATGNTTTSNLAPILFEDVSFPDNFDWTKIELWDDYSDLYGGPIYYNQGDYVYYYPTGDLYLCIESGSHTGKSPLTNPTTWQLVTPMADDFRQDSTSPYPGIGLLD